MGTRLSLRRNESVSLDWGSNLCAEKNQSYYDWLDRLEQCYRMFSVNLDEALGMRRIGRPDKASQILTLAPALCDKFTMALRSHLCAMSLHARHFGTAPNMAALDPANFQDSRSQRAARLSGIVSRVLLTRRLQFLQKLSTLAELVEDLGTSYDDNAQGMGEGFGLDCQENWQLLDSSHYDLNTCLRETVVLWKCFLLALPESQLSGFRVTLQEQSLPTKQQGTSLVRKS